jgi:hypothetical protein
MNENIKIQVSPIMLTIVVVSAMLSLYIPGHNAVVTVFTFFVQPFLFFFFDKVKSSGKQGTVMYGIAFVVLTMVTISLIRISGQPVNFIHWLMNGQKPETDLLPYEIACFICVNYIIASFLYYYTQVIYRRLFVLMVTIMPLALSVKCYVSLSVIYIILLLTLYLAVMIQCRQKKNPQQLWIATDHKYANITSAGVFLLLTAVVTVLLPKPEITPFRESNAALALTSGMMNLSNQLGNFSDRSGTAENPTSHAILYRVIAPESLYFRRQTFDLYQGSYWICIDRYADTGSADWYLRNRGKILRSLYR